MNQFIRTEILLGKEAMNKLEKCHVAIFGLGGVGSYATEAMVRCGIGNFSLYDHDTVSISNMNRQIIATYKTVGRHKVEVMNERIEDINPNALVNTYKCFYEASNADSIHLSEYSYIIDAIDTVSSKLLLIENAYKANIPIISCMGTGNKLDPTRLEVTDIYKTKVCPLAKVMRHELKKRGINDLKVVFSSEEPIKPLETHITEEDISCESEKAVKKRATIGSVSYVPSSAGLLIASEVIKDLLQY